MQQIKIAWGGCIIYRYAANASLLLFIIIIIIIIILNHHHAYQHGLHDGDSLTRR